MADSKLGQAEALIKTAILTTSIDAVFFGPANNRTKLSAEVTWGGGAMSDDTWGALDKTVQFNVRIWGKSLDQVMKASEEVEQLWYVAANREAMGLLDFWECHPVGGDPPVYFRGSNNEVCADLLFECQLRATTA